ncbi:MAG: peptidylprolyl isomerase [Flavobacteriales bacterium]|nr:peptidylprolyl isomerase [Flavobacteriales bacterium]
MKKGILSALLVGSAAFLFAQNADPVVMKVGNEEIPLSEFEAIFLKNHPKEKSVTRAELDEYSGLFTNFKLKVQAAKAAGVDTTAAFKSEFNGYKKQLGQPYLKDKAKEDLMLNEIMERVKQDLNVSHILIKAKGDCMLPADTLELYKKAMDIRKRIQKGEAFEKVANEVSEDGYSNKNGGELGWFSGMMWAYNFESAAFSLKKGEVSMPVKTSLGYHLIKLNDSRPARGELKAAHIFVAPASQSEEDKAKAKTKINEAYAALKAGTPWLDVVTKYSEDRTTVPAGGELPVFGISKMVQEFEDAAFALKNEGDISEPVATSYGFHIIKLLTKINKTPSEENREQFRKQLQKNVRNKLVVESFTQKVKTEYGFKENAKLLEKIKALETKNPGKMIRVGMIDSLPDEMLFTLNGKNVMLSEFASFVKARMPRGGEVNYCNLDAKYYQAFVEQKATEFAEANLENKYPEYKALLKEYREGIMIFEMMDKKVWSKSAEDTTGLKTFFENNRNKYMWKERVVAQRVIAGDSATLVKVRKEAQKVITGKSTVENLKLKFNKKGAVISVTEELKEAGESAELDALGSEPKVGIISKSKENWYFYIITGKRAAEPKDLKNAKGLVISDYQNYLETEWLKELKKAYPVQVNKEIMYRLAK